MKGGYQIIDLKGFNKTENAITGKATGTVEGIADAVLNKNDKPLLIENGKVTSLGGVTFDINGWLNGFIVENDGVKSYVSDMNGWEIIIILNGVGKDTFSIQVTPTI